MTYQIYDAIERWEEEALAAANEQEDYDLEYDDNVYRIIQAEIERMQFEEQI